jgi:sideroflexin-5
MSSSSSSSSSASTPSNSLPFTLTGTRYDLSTMTGRFYHFLNIVDPRTLISTDQTLRQAKEELNQFKLGQSTRTNEELWKYRSLVESAIHPTTDEIIPWPFRMSAIAPVNIPIVWGMLACPPSNTALTLFLHFVNQSYNTGCNYFNRSGADMSMKEIGTAYTLAVGSACSLAYGLGKIYEKGPPALKRFGVLIPCLATAAANVSNIALTRASEITNGVPVMDAEGQVRGSSVTAGFLGVSQSAVSRCVLVPFSTLLVPTGIMAILRK